jgi:hypothetical protein
LQRQKKELELKLQREMEKGDESLWRAIKVFISLIY